VDAMQRQKETGADHGIMLAFITKISEKLTNMLSIRFSELHCTMAMNGNLWYWKTALEVEIRPFLVVK